jgi:hypothetical protein
MIETAIFTSPDGNGTRWRLLGATDDAVKSRHHVRLKFDIAAGQILGYLVLWGTDEEIPLDDVQFNGTALSFRLPAIQKGVRVLAPGFTRAPRLLATLVGDREFRGYYVDESDARLEPAIELKLVKEEDEVITL